MSQSQGQDLAMAINHDLSMMPPDLHHPTPTLTLVSPRSGALVGGTQVTLTGTGFLQGAAVTFAGQQATAVSVQSDTSISATTPTLTGAWGAVPVQVTNADGQSVKADSLYYYAANQAIINSNNPPQVTLLSAPQLALADFNQDGVQDLVYSSGMTTLAVSLAMGNGAFAAAHTYTTANTPAQPVIGDINGDGVPDVFVPTFNGGMFHFFLGSSNKDGTLGSRNDITTGEVHYTLAVADLNKDNMPDVIAPGYNSGNLLVYQNDGQSIFLKQTTVMLGAGVHARTLAVADLNKDGYPDVLAVGDGTGMNGTTPVAAALYVSLGGMNFHFGTVTPYPAGQVPNAIAIGDFNGDGYPDAALTSQGDNTLSVYLNKGDGTLLTRVPYATGQVPLGLVAADLNADGWLDLTLLNNQDPSVGVLMGQANGLFASMVSFTSPAGPFVLCVGDVLGNKRPDVVVALNPGTNIAIFPNISH